MKVSRFFAYSLLVCVTLYGLDSGLKYALELYKNNKLYNNQKAISSLVTQAKSGDTSAAFLLASAYKNGKLGKVNLDKSFYWYKQAAILGDPDAMLMLGWLYYKGTSKLQMDMKKAKYWFNKAAIQGVDEAIEMLELLG